MLIWCVRHIHTPAGLAPARTRHAVHGSEKRNVKIRRNVRRPVFANNCSRIVHSLTIGRGSCSIRSKPMEDVASRLGFVHPPDRPQCSAFHLSHGLLLSTVGAIDEFALSRTMKQW